MDNLIRIKDIANLKSIKSSDIGALSYLPLEEVESWNGKVKKYQKNEDFSGDVNLFECGDVLFNKLRPYLAKVVHADRDGGVSNEAMVLEPLKNINGRYLFYKLLSSDFITMIDSYTYGTKMPRANPLDIMTSKINLPDLQLQEDLVSKLDFKSEVVDKQIKALTQKLHHLEEYKTALIHNAVTKGLDANGRRIIETESVSKIIRFKDAATFISGKAVSPSDLKSDKNNYRYLSMSSLSGRRGDDKFIISPAPEMQFKNRDEFVLGHYGFSFADNGGTTGLVTDFDGRSGFIDSNFLKIYTNSNYHSKYIQYALFQNGVLDQIKIYSRGAIAVFIGRQKPFIELKVFNDLKTQKVIVDFLDEKLKVLRKIKNNTSTKIDLLLEYKKSLINEAVSGQ